MQVTYSVIKVLGRSFHLSASVYNKMSAVVLNLNLRSLMSLREINSFSRFKEIDQFLKQFQYSFHVC